MLKSELQIRIENMGGAEARGFAKIHLAAMKTKELGSAKPCPDILAFIEQAEKEIDSCTNGHDILRMPIAFIAGWTRDME